MAVSPYPLYKVRAVLLHPSIIAWAILFVLFWAVMWIYVFGSSLAKYRGRFWYGELVSSYVATAYSSLAMISVGSIAVGLTSSLAAASPALRFVTRFTRLTSRRLVVEDTLASLTVQAIAIAVLITATTLMAWHRYGVLVTPHNTAALVGAHAPISPLLPPPLDTSRIHHPSSRRGGVFGKVMEMLPLIILTLLKLVILLFQFYFQLRVI
jgi:hypothetical protein